MTLYDDPEYWERKRKQTLPQTDHYHPQPDPAWDYAHLWPNLCDLAKLSQDLQSFISNVKTAKPESDQELRARLALIQGLVSQTLNKLEMGESGSGS